MDPKHPIESDRGEKIRSAKRSRRQERIVYDSEDESDSGVPYKAKPVCPDTHDAEFDLDTDDAELDLDTDDAEFDLDTEDAELDLDTDDVESTTQPVHLDTDDAEFSDEDSVAFEEDDKDFEGEHPGLSGLDDNTSALQEAQLDSPVKDYKPPLNVDGLPEEEVRAQYIKYYGLSDDEAQEVMEVRRKVKARWNEGKTHNELLLKRLTSAVDHIKEKEKMNHHARFFLDSSASIDWAKEMADSITPDMVSILTGNQCPSLSDFRNQKGVTSREFGVYIFMVMEPGSTTKGNLYSGSATGRIGLVGRVEMRNFKGILVREPNSELAKLLWNGVDKEVVVVTAMEITGSQDTPTGYERQRKQFVSVLFENVLHNKLGTWQGLARNRDSLWSVWWKGLNRLPPLYWRVELGRSFKKMTGSGWSKGKIVPKSMRGSGKLDDEAKAALKELRSHENKLRNAAMTDEQRKERNKYWLTENVPPARKERRKKQARERRRKQSAEKKAEKEKSAHFADPELLETLLATAKEYSGHRNRWNLIGERVNKKASVCKYFIQTRYPELFEEIKRKEYFGSPEDVEALLAAVGELGGQWSLIAKKLGKPAAACRAHIKLWNPDLFEQVKRPAHFRDHKDVEVLLAAVRQHGPQWKLIGKEIHKPWISCMNYVRNWEPDLFEQIKLSRGSTKGS